MFKKLRRDIQAIKEKDPAARNSFEVVLLYSGLHALMLHRPAYWLYNHRLFFLARFVSQIARFITGIEIHPGAKVGRGVFIDHGSGLVIGETAEVGDGCTLYQGVTLGGTGKECGKRHPTLGKNVTVGAGAKILGPFKIGDNAKIASNAVVLKEIPPNATAVGVPAKVVRVNGVKVQEALDHVNMPDPVGREIQRLHKMISNLEKRIDNMEKAGDDMR